jgi:GDP-L-fucose synthase
MLTLITGGWGFLGQHLQKIAPRPDWHFPTRRELDLYRPDADDYISQLAYGRIVHLAANCGGIGYNIAHPADLLRDNVAMALTIFEAARKYKIPEVVTIGSTCQYPAMLEPPFFPLDMHEGEPEPTNAAYGFGKRFLALMGRYYAKQYGISHKHIILANLYGPGEDMSENGHVVGSLVRKALAEPVIEVWGDGTAQRELLYVSDAAGIIRDIALYPIERGDNREVNVGGAMTTIGALACDIRDLCAPGKGICFSPDKPSGQVLRMLDAEYRGKTNLREGLSKTIEWARGIILTAP